MSHARELLVSDNQLEVGMPGANSNTEAVVARAGERFGNYVVESLLGQGGQGSVYLARDVNLHRVAALKICRDASTLMPVQEARLLARLNHPNIIEIYQLERVGNYWYAAMEYVEGGSVGDLLKRAGPLDVGAAVKIARETAAALAYSHRAGVVHADVKPHNLLIASDGSIRLVDFGLASTLRTGGGRNRPVGTPPFIAPELFEGMSPSPKGDVYSLGVTLTKMLSDSRSLFIEGPEDAGRGPRIDLSAVPSRVPRRLGRLLVAMLAPSPRDRPDAGEVLRALSGSSRVEPSVSRRESTAKRRAARDVVAATTVGRLAQRFISGDLLGQLFPCELTAEALSPGPGETVLFGAEHPGAPRAVAERIFKEAGRSIDWTTASLEAEAEAAPKRGGLRAVAVSSELAPERAAELVRGWAQGGAGVLAVGLHADLDRLALALGDAGLAARRLALPAPTAEKMTSRLSRWSVDVTDGRITWSPTALALVHQMVTTAHARLDLLAHNATVICVSTGQRVVTSWHVCGADAHGAPILEGAQVEEKWRRPPATWPDPTMLALYPTIHFEAVGPISHTQGRAK